MTPAPTAGADYMVGGPAPPPNDGNTGSVFHWRMIRRLRNYLRRRGYADLRTDQQQVKTARSGTTVVAGNNRPDLQATRDGRRVVVEVDTDRVSSLAHQRVVSRRDPTARGIYVVIHPTTGRVREYRTFNPATGRTTVRRWPTPAARARRP
jgi:hypothetical protein